MSKKILILGATGKVGEAVTDLFLNEYKDARLVLCTGSAKKITARTRCQRVEIDYADRSNVEEVLEEYSPDCVVNAAAMTGVDECEDEKDLAMILNCELPRILAGYANKNNAHLIHYSTDYIFDGEGGPYLEDDKPGGAISYYGYSKLAGENAIVSEFGGEMGYTIFRTNVVYGRSRYGKNDFINWIIRCLENEKEMKIIDGQWCNPTFSDDLAWATLKAFEQEIFGVFNIAGKDYLSRYDIAMKVCDVLNYDRGLLTKIKANKLVQKAKRPRKGGLVTEKAELVFGMKMSGVSRGILQMKERTGND